jgi:hypothetical protein
MIPNSLYAIAESAGLLHQPGDVIEVRIPHTRSGTVLGYFSDPYWLANAVAPWNGRASIYITLNLLKPEVRARANNRLLKWARSATDAEDVVARLWWGADLDPVRPKGIPSSNEELEAACQRRDELVTHLVGAGFPDPLRIRSGNGAWALWRVNLPNTEETTRLYQGTLEALNETFSDAAVTIDPAVYQPAQLVKLPGTIAVKGDPIPGRPHRRATIQAPIPRHLVEEPQLVTIDQLRWLAAQSRERGARRSVPTRSGTIDLVALFKARNLYRRALPNG